MFTTTKNFLIALYLFNKADFRTTIFPVTVFAQSLASNPTLSSFNKVVFWVWMHLLMWTVANQVYGESPEEDLLNKPHRPIPAKRISLAAARVLRWILIPVCIGMGFYFDTVIPSASFALLTVIYNQGEGHNHWLTKNGLCGLGYAALEFGATTVAERSSEPTLNRVGAVIGSAVIIATTIQAQDFKDVIGDAVFKRKTLPIVFPVAARAFMPILLGCWSIATARFSDAHDFVRYGLIVLGSIVGMRFWLLETTDEDRMSCLLYNIWLGVAHMTLSKLNLEGFKAMV